MSEYIEIETEDTEDINVLILEANVTLASEGVEEYASAESMEEGSPLAQALSVVYGIEHVLMDEFTLTITRDPEADWYAIVEDIRSALIDFFL